MKPSCYYIYGDSIPDCWFGIQKKIVLSENVCTKHKNAMTLDTVMFPELSYAIDEMSSKSPLFIFFGIRHSKFPYQKKNWLSFCHKVLSDYDYKIITQEDTQEFTKRRRKIQWLQNVSTKYNTNYF